MRKGAIAAGLVLHLGLAAPASAKAPAMTWEVLPERPVAGAPVTLVMRSWSWGPDGPDLSQPWEFWPADRVRLGIRAVLLGTDRTAPVPAFGRVGAATYRTTIRLPRPGRWALGWKGGEPYAEGEDPFGFPVIDVRPAEGGTAMRKTAAAMGVAAALGLGLPAAPASAGGGGSCRDAVASRGSGTVVRMEDNCFVPTVLRAPSGSEIAFVNEDQAGHTVTGIGPWGTGHEEIAPDTRLGLTFAEDGVYVYTCLLHPGMAGAVVVGSPSGPGAADGPEVAVGELEGPADEAAEGATARLERVADSTERADGLPVPGIAAGVGVAGAGLGFGLGRRRRR